MHELLKNYISKKEVQKKETYEKEKRNLLISQGLYEKIYSDEPGYSQEFPNQEWDPATNDHKYYKMVPIEITEEEYEIIKEYSNTTSPVKRNAAAIILFSIAGAIFGLGFFAGIIIGTEVEDFLITLIYWIGSFAIGMMLIGFAEIIRLLNEIKNKLYSKK